MTYNFTWTLEPKEPQEVWYVGILGDAANDLPPFWFAGFGEEGERRWVKYKNDAMTFKTREEAVDTWKELGHSDDGFMVKGEITPDPWF